MHSVTLAAACHAPILSGETLEQLMPVLSSALLPALSAEAVRQVDTQPRQPDRYGRVTVVASVTTGVLRPVLSWTHAARGASILHELVHIAQRRLEGPELRELMTQIARYDADTGFSAYVVNGATNSTVVGMRKSLPAEQGRYFAARMSREMARAPIAGPGALEARLRIFRRVLREPQFKPVRDALQATRPSRLGWASGLAGEPWSWTDELAAKVLFEAMAYDADSRCVHGRAPRFLI